MQSMPFPSNDDAPLIDTENKLDPKTLPWKKLHPNESMPMCFEVRSRNGQIDIYPYSDFRGIKLLHAGYLIVNIFGMEKTQLLIRGRNLSELAKHLSLGRVHWFGETQKKNYELPEACPHIESITVELLS